MKKLAAALKRDIATIAAKTDATIDFSDMPEVTDWSGAEIGRFYRPTKRPVTMRLDDDVIAWLKSYGRGYQTKANLLLRHAMESSLPASAKRRRTAQYEAYFSRVEGPAFQMFENAIEPDVQTLIPNP
jgi:uncharacterized protein (DUF4415 family)